MKRIFLAAVICLFIAFVFVNIQIARAGLSPAQVVAKRAILKVWGHGARGRLGLKISWCESTWRTWAKNGSHLGLFQMGRPERRTYGHGPGAVTQARAALHYYFDSGTSPWYASKYCWA